MTPSRTRPADVETSKTSRKRAPQWTISDAVDLYGIDRWGKGYFGVNEQGHVVVHPTGEPDVAVDLKQLVDELQERGLQPPLLLRFTDILKQRMADLHAAFTGAMSEYGYQGEYRAVYPIKVNQQRQVVQEIVEFGKREFGFGVEAGSKPELLAVDGDGAVTTSTPIICNGFKDAEYIEAVVLAKPSWARTDHPRSSRSSSELELIAKLREAACTVSSRPSASASSSPSRGAGRWEQSGGARSEVRPVPLSEVLAAVELPAVNAAWLDSLKLLHFHLGSQINNIQNVKAAIIELSRVYVELNRAGAKLKYLDVGGGLGVDYNGSHTNSESSINYTMREYANDVVYHVMEVCDQAGVDHPTIISESGRAMTAFSSVLVCNVVGWTGLNRLEFPAAFSDEDRQALPRPVRSLVDCFAEISADNYLEFFHDAVLYRDEALNAFNLGYCSLEHRALAERLYFGVCVKVQKTLENVEHVPEELKHLERALADMYYCNYSIFQSLPDSWAIDQLFPIMPIHRLDEEPTCHGILADVTCDSDGKVDKFIGRYESKPALELHPYTGDDYFLATFLVGAYQEILGDLHNLFGDTNAVHVSLDEDGEPEIDEVVEGDTVRKVLGYVQFSPDELLRKMRKRVERAVRKKKLTLDESRRLMKFYVSGLEGYTYLE